MKKEFTVFGHGVTVDLSGTFLCVAGLILGIVLLICPGAAVEILLNCIGGALIVIGVIDVIRFLVAERKGSGHSNELTRGLTGLAGGIIAIVFKGTLVSIMPLIYGFAILIGGFFKLQGALVALRTTPVRAILLLAATLLSVVVGVLIIVNPFATGLLLMRFIGAGLVYECVVDLIYRIASGKRQPKA